MEIILPPNDLTCYNLDTMFKLLFVKKSIFISTIKLHFKVSNFFLKLKKKLFSFSDSLMQNF